MAKNIISKRLLQLKPSPTLELDSQVKKMQADGVSVINLTLGEPDFQTPKYIQNAAIQALRSGFTHYVPSAGIMELRAAIADKLHKENNIKYQPKEIIVGVGTKQILYSIFQTLCQKGDEVIVPTPTWLTYIEQIKLSEGKPVFVKLDSPFKLKAKDIQKHLTSKTKIILLNSPANPTGAVIGKEELEKIAELAVKHHIFVVSDEIYEKIIYERKHCSIASFGENIKQITITVNGFSKAYAMTGWRIGYAAGPIEIINKMIDYCGQTTFGTNSFGQKAAVIALQGKQTSILKMVDEFTKRRNVVFNKLNKIKNISLQKPEGAFYFFINVKSQLGEKYKTSSDWAKGLLNEFHVGVVPGEAFLAPGFIRVSFAASMDSLERGVSGIEKFSDKNDNQ